jgi:hypothetical protein
MSALNQFRLDLPSGNTYASETGIDIEFKQQSQAVFESGSLFANIVSKVSGASSKQAITLNLGGGVRFVTIRFRNFKGNTNTWGNANSDDGPLTKLQYLEQDLANAEIGSNNPATLSVGEYSSSGVFDPLQVGFRSAELTYDIESGPSDFSGTLKFVETTDLNEVIEDLQ